MADLNIQLILRLVDRATGPARAAMRAIERIGGDGVLQQARMVEAGARRMGAGFADMRDGALRGAAVATAYTGVMAALAGSFIRPAAEMERFKVQLTNLEGSSAGAERAMAWISEFATRTPLELNDTVAAYARLRAFGLDPTNGSLQALVDTMAATGGGAEQLDGLVMALGQSWTKGKLQSEEALQMLERGVPVWDLLAAKMGKTAAEVQELATKGKLGRAEIMLLVEALGTRNSGASEGMSKTWDGLISNLMDHWSRFQVMVMDAGLFDWLKSRLQSILDMLNTMAADGRLQAWASQISAHVIAVLEAVQRFGSMLVSVWSGVFPYLERAAELLGGWDRLGFLAVAVLMRGTVLQLALGFGRLGLGAGQAVGGLLAMLMPMNLLRTASLAFIATGLGAVLAGLALAGLWIWHNWEGLAAFFSEFGAAFMEALGPAAPMVEALGAKLAAVRDWVLSITGPVDASGESWRRWGRATGLALGNLVRTIRDWLAAHPRFAQALAYILGALGALRLLATPVAAGWRLLTAVASGLGTVLGFAARAVQFLGRVMLIAGRAMLANPILLIIAAIAAGAYLIYANWDTIGPWFARLWEGVAQVFRGFIDFVAGVFTGDLGRAIGGLNGMWEGLGSVWGTLWQGLGTNLRMVWDNVIKPVTDKLGVTGHITAAWEAVRASFAVILEGIQSAFSTMWGVVKPIIEGLKWVAEGSGMLIEKVGAMASAINPFSGDTGGSDVSGAMDGNPALAVAEAGQRALGGPVRAGMIYRWNEQGRELFMPRVDGHVMPNRQLRALEAATASPALRVVSSTPAAASRPGPAAAPRIEVGGITIHAAPGQSPAEIARAVRREFEAATRERSFALHDGGQHD